MTVSDEQAKAVQEVAKLGNNALATVHGVGRFAERIFGPAANEIGVYLGDRFRAWRAANIRAVLARAEEIHRARGISDRVEPIPPRVGIAIIEAASKEDESSLQEMWAALLANTADPARKAARSRSFATLLATFEPVDALVLREIIRRTEHEEPSLPISDLSSLLGTPLPEVRLSLEHLAKEGCIKADQVDLGWFVEPGSPEDRLESTAVSYVGTWWGYTFLKACKAEL